MMKKINKMKKVIVVVGVITFAFMGMLLWQKVNTKASSNVSDNTISFVFNNFAELTTSLNSFVVPKTAEYNFYCKPTKKRYDGTEHYWKVYVLNDNSYEKTSGSLRHIHQVYKETAKIYSEKTKLKLKEGQYVYAVCSENGFAFTEDYDTFRCPLVVQEVKDDTNVIKEDNSKKFPADEYKFVFNKYMNMNVNCNSLVVPKDGVYTLNCMPNKGGNIYWNIYVFDDNTYKMKNNDLREMLYKYKPTYKVNRNQININLKRGQYLYAICSENGYKHSQDFNTFRCPLTIKMIKNHK